VIAFRAELDTPEQAHGRVSALLGVLEENGVEVLDGDPAEDGASLLHIGPASGHQLTNLSTRKLSTLNLLALDHLFLTNNVNKLKKILHFMGNKNN
jgi:hypothetical protein